MRTLGEMSAIRVSFAFTGLADRYRSRELFR
jgi:hypothetical protein